MAQSATIDSVLQLSRPARFPASRALLERHARTSVHHDEPDSLDEAEIDGEGVQMGDARRVVPKGDGTGCSPAVQPRDALKSVAKEFSVSEKDLRGRSTTAKVSWARDELCRRLRGQGFTYAEIGEFLGGRTHSAVIAAVRRAQSRVDMS